MARRIRRPRRVSRVRSQSDMVQEFKVETNTTARSTAGGRRVFNVITKSGSNQYHGTLYEFFRNDKLNANNFFANASDALVAFQVNQFGGTIGGPGHHSSRVQRPQQDVLLFSIEDVRFIQGDVFVGTLPLRASCPAISVRTSMRQAR